MKIDYSSNEWLGIAAYVQGELSRLQKCNDQVGLPVAETEALRGEIRLCKKLLALPEQADRDIGDAPDY